MAGSELLRRLQGLQNGPHGVGGQHGEISISNASHYSTSNSATLDFALRIQLLRKLFDLYTVLLTTTPWLSRTVVHKLKHVRLHSLYYHGLQYA
jgi:hypothetical protein